MPLEMLHVNSPCPALSKNAAQIQSVVHVSLQIWPSLTALPPDLALRGLCLYNTELNSCKIRGKPVAVDVQELSGYIVGITVWEHRPGEKVTFTLFNHQHLCHQQRVCVLLWTTGRSSPRSVVPGGSAGKSRGLCPWDASKGARPAEAAHPCLPHVTSGVLVKAACSLESSQALSTPRHDSAQRPLKICSR